MRTTTYALLFLLSLLSSATSAAPVSIDNAEIRAGDINFDFALQAEGAVTTASGQIRSRFGTEAADRFLAAIELVALNNPRPLDRAGVDRIFCKGRFDFFGNFPGKDTAFHNCIESTSGTQIMFSQEAGSTDLSNYFYLLLQREVDFRSWLKLQISQLVTDHVGLGLNPAESSQLAFDPRIVQAYLQRRLSAAGLELKDKTEELINPIAFDARNLTEEFARDRRPNRLNFPFIITSVTCAGSCVAIERSTFVSQIGTYTYAFQILFHTDVWTKFAENYAGLQGFGPNIDWFVWSDLIAGNGDFDSLRSSAYFREALKNVVIRGAIQ